MMKQITYKFIRYWSPILFYCLAIYLQSSYPSLKEIPHSLHMDKLFHFAGYALLGLLFIRGFRNSRFGENYKFIITVSIILTGLYGAGDELHQHYVPTRTADHLDILFDLMGGAFGVCIYQIITKNYPGMSRI